MGDLLRLGRVLGAGLRFAGRYRAASAVAFVLALGWFLFGLGLGPADAAGATLTDDDALLRAPGPSAGASALDGLLTDAGGTALGIWLASAVVVSLVCFGLCALVLAGDRWLLRDDRDSVPGRVLDGGAGSDPARPVPAGPADRGQPRLVVGKP